MEREKHYAVCGSYVGMDFSSLNWQIVDGRFEVQKTYSDEAEMECSNTKPSVTYLTAVRRNDTGCGTWCSRYLPWEEGESYDLELTRSIERVNLAATIQDDCLNKLDILGELLSRNLTEEARKLFEVSEDDLDDDLDANRLHKGKTYLQVAIERGNQQNMELLLKHFANVELQNEDGNTALVTAGRLCQVHTLRELLDNGANASRENKNEYVSPGCAITVLSSVLTDYDESVCKGQVPEVVKMLTDIGGAVFNTSSCDYRGYIMHKAIEQMRLPAMEAVLQAGYSPDEKLRTKSTPMKQLFLYRNGEDNKVRFLRAVQLLAKYGADVNTDVFHGKTPAALSAEWCDGPLLQELLEAKANPHTADNDGKDALDLAKEKNCSAVIHLLSKQ
ncbi:mask [Symbiodinium necroappetens]|uniref:Mask protein n=1 Tax=Symbiodinium necroappetens TaxID=1628268 RepID=A0A812Q103_9DINO|nr:mask [Symbiodinium necroappetens]